MLASMEDAPFPVAMGVLYCNPAEISYEAAVWKQTAEIVAKAGEVDLNKMLRRGNTWTAA